MSEPRERPSRPPMLDDHDRPGPPPMMSEEQGRMSKGLTVFIALFSLAAFGAIVWYAYDRGLRTGFEETAPLIRADDTPIRVKPKNPGGMKVPHQDKMIFDRLSEVDTPDQPVERLLPRPEEPALVGKKLTDKAKLDPSASAGVATPVVTMPTDRTASNSGNKTQPSSGETPDAKPDQQVQSKLPVLEQKLQRGTVLSAATQPANASPPPIKSTVGGSFRVQIGAFKNEGKARDVWRRAKASHAELLGALSLSIQKVKLPGKGTFHRVQGGPLSKAQASLICRILKARKQDCMVKKP